MLHRFIGIRICDRFDLQKRMELRPRRLSIFLLHVVAAVMNADRHIREGILQILRWNMSLGTVLFDNFLGFLNHAAIDSGQTLQLTDRQALCFELPKRRVSPAAVIALDHGSALCPQAFADDGFRPFIIPA